MQQRGRKPKNEQSEQELPNIWEVLEKRKEKGLWHGEIEVHEIKETNITKGTHYYVVENPRTGSVKCTSCSISHGHILEPHLLTRYDIRDGVIYFDGKAITQAPTRYG